VVYYVWCGIFFFIILFFEYGVWYIMYGVAYHVWCGGVGIGCRVYVVRCRV
jgi:hypothetical protein